MFGPPDSPADASRFSEVLIRERWLEVHKKRRAGQANTLERCQSEWNFFDSSLSRRA